MGDRAEEKSIFVVSDKAPAYSWYALGLLTFVFLLNFLDRTLIYILFTPIKKEMTLSDLQLAVLGTTSFVIFYTLLGIPFGRMADKVVRKNLIAAGLVVWSLFSGLTGFADSFWSIFFCRVMVGVGEATLGPAALSLLSDYFPARMRATVQAIYSSGIPFGSAAAFFLGGWIGQSMGWRWAFYMLGFPGLFVAVLVLSLREPQRGRTDAIAAQFANKDWKILFKSVPLRYHNLGYAMFAVAANSLSVWGPLFFSRVHGLTIVMIGAIAGALSIIGGAPGTVFGGFVADRLRRTGKGGRMLFTASAALCCVPFWLAFIYSGSIPTLLAATFFLLATALMWVGPAAADVHDIVGPQLRGLGIGIYFFIMNIIGYGIGPPIIGKLNDWLGADKDPTMMRYSLLVCPAACVLSALLLWMGSRKLEAQK